VIRTEALTFRFAGGKALHFADVDLPQGATLLLRGPSGSGKSTWLALAAGLLRPEQGRITVAGQCVGDLAGARLDAWRGSTIGFLPQRLHLSEALTVQGNLALAYVAAGLPVDSSSIARALQALGVSELAQRRPAQLSGGQAQRVALARAVLRRPSVLLVDEPTASLDDEACAHALGLLQMAASGASATLVMATHDRRVAQAWPDVASLHLVQAPMPEAT